MNERSERTNNQQKYACRIADQACYLRSEMAHIVMLSALLLLGFFLMAGRASAAPIISLETTTHTMPSMDQSYRIAQSSNSFEDWQDNAFRSIDMRRRLDALSRLRKTEKPRRQKRRPLVRKKRKIAQPIAKKKITSKPVVVITQTEIPSKPQDMIRFAAAVQDPEKLQRCLQSAGHFNGVVTGRLDEATLQAMQSFRDADEMRQRMGKLHDPALQKALFANCPDSDSAAPNKIVADQVEKKPAVLEQLSQNVEKPAPQISLAPLKPMRPIADDEAPEFTASIKVTKKQARFPGAAEDEAVVKSQIVQEEDFALDILAATKKDLAKPKGEGADSIAETTSSYPIIRAKTPLTMSASGVPKMASARLASAGASSSMPQSSTPFSKKLSIADLAMAQPVNPNTCSPGQHKKPVATMSSVLAPPPGYEGPFMETAALVDDGPTFTSSISSSSVGRSLRKRANNAARLVTTKHDDKACLPQDLYDMMASTHGRKTNVAICKSACLPAPKSFSPGQKDIFAKQYDINWCGAGCLGVANALPLPEVMKIEREARVNVCMTPQVRMVSAVKKGLDSAGINKPIRSLYDRLPGGYGNEDNIAVIIGNRNYGREIKVFDAGHVNAAAMKALLIDQLGYKTENVITLKDARRAEFVKLFGKRGDPKGELATRLKANPDAQLMIYYSGHASTSGLGMDNYLLPIDAVPGSEKKTAYSLSVLYDNLREFDARTTQLFLETGFGNNRSHLILPPNISERHVNVAPIVPVRGLAVFTATTGDQKPLIDTQMGIGLFTRYLVSGLAGAADARPIGNGDRIIDSVELHVHLASKVRLAARKTQGLRQNPTLSRSDNLFLSQLSKKPRR